MTIVFVHGNFITRLCWEKFVPFFESRGYDCVAIPYPLRDDTVDELRARHPDPDLARLALSDVLNDHVRVIRELPEKPIIVGHSFGGLLTQLLVQRDLAAAAVTIDSVPPANVVGTQWSFLRSVLPAINPLKRSQPYLMPFSHFQYTFANGMPLAAQREAYDRQVVPESRVLAAGGLSPLARVDFARAHPPLLMIAGTADHIMPAALNRKNFKRYGASTSSTEFKEFPGRTHYTVIAGPGWEEVAGYVLTWVERTVGKPASRAVNRARDTREPTEARP